MVDDGSRNKDQSPLQGVVLCCTSIPQEQRSNMAMVAQQMGAVHKLDLTSDVTHLVVGNIDTPKYKYVARERPDIKILGPAWLDAVRASWMEGGDTDVSSLEDEYSLATFAGLRVCVTGFEDLDERNRIQETVSTNGAVYHGDLTKNVTHLIAAAPKGKKYDYAGQWNIKTVSIEWLRDSLARGMVLDEALYNLQIPVAERGKGAIAFQTRPPQVLGKRSRQDDKSTSVGQGSGGRKLRRVASQKLESQNDDLWADIGRAEPEVKGEQDSCWSAHATSEGLEGRSGRPVETLRPSRDMNGSRKAGAPDDHNSGSNKGDGLAGVFNEVGNVLRVYIHGFDERKTSILEGHLASNGAELVSKDDLRARIAGQSSSEPSGDVKDLTGKVAVTVVVPHDAEPDSVQQLGTEDWIAYQDELVTDLWVEKCLMQKKIVDRYSPLCQPFKRFPIRGFESLTICPTSFTGIDLLHFSKVVKLMGATYDECLRNDVTSLLVCNGSNFNREKIMYALQNDIAIVSAHWLWQSVWTGEMQAARDFQLSEATLRSGKSQHLFFDPATNPRPVRSTVGGDSFSSRRDSGIGGEPDAEQRQLLAETQRKQRGARPNALIGAAASKSISPLRERPPEVNSRRRASSNSPGEPPAKAPLITHDTDSDPTHLPSPRKTSEPPHITTADSLTPVAPDEPTPTAKVEAAISHLLAHARPAASASAQASAGPATLPPSLRHRKLGRAASGTGAALSRASSAAAAGNGPPATDDAADIDVPAAPYCPSQALVYEDAEALALREKARRRMGVAPGDDADDAAGAGMTRVASIGVVTDGVALSAGADRRKAMRPRREAPSDWPLA